MLNICTVKLIWVPGHQGIEMAYNDDKNLLVAVTKKNLDSLQPDDLQAKPIDYQGYFGERCENELITCCLWIRYQLQVTV